MELNRIQKSARAKPIALVSAVLLITLMVTLFSSNVIFAAKPVPVTLDPKTIPKYVNQLVVPPVYSPDAGAVNTYTVEMVTTRQQILPLGTPGVVLPGGGIWDGMTDVWGYKGNAIIKGSTLTQLNAAWVNGYTQTGFVWSPSATFETVKNTPITVNWVNKINVRQPFAVDPTLYWANPWKNYDPTKAFPDGDIFSAIGGPFLAFPPGYVGTGVAGSYAALNAQEPVPLVPHLHGAEVPSQYDGGPEAWWTSAATNLKGPNYNSAAAAPAGTAVYVYPNAQEPNTLWYHDHALGITRINVMSGLAGFYLLRDPGPWDGVTPLTSANLDEYLTQTFQYGISDIPIAIQDRTFKTDGELWFPEIGLNPTIHPYWMPEFFGNTIMVNGMVWPNLDVTPGWYRFRLLDGSNARFYTMSFSNGMPFTMIGADGGYLQAPVVANTLTIAPGERADILVQFTPAMVGQKIILTNTAKAPFPNGAPADKQTVGQIMQFTVKDPAVGPVVTQGVTTIQTLPATLNPTLGTVPGTWPTLSAASVKKTRYITLNEVMGPAGPVMVLINGQHYYAVTTETPIYIAPSPGTAPTVEDWVIINLTADTHPIHLHLVTFQLVSRQPFQAGKYNTAWLKMQIDPNTLLQLAPAFPDYYVPKELPPMPWYQRATILATPTEMGWKDTLQMNPGEVTTIRVRYTSQDGSAFPFDPTAGPGYVWHCHIIDHEDNEMMRPLIIK